MEKIDNGMEGCRSTIIIPNYNGMAYLENCLASLRGEPARVIVVDNGSTDGSRELVQEKFPKVRLISLDRNYGFCRAVNRGMEASETTYVILLNNDTEAQPGFVKALEKAMDGDERVFSGAARMVRMDAPSRIDDAGDYYCALGWAFAAGRDKPAENYDAPREIFSACGGACIYRRRILQKIGMLDENHFAYLEDIDIGFRALIHGWHNVYEPQARVLHAGSGVSGSRYNAFKVKLSSANNAYMIGKNMPFLQILLNFPLLFLGFCIKTAFFTKKKMGMLYVKGYAEGIARCFGSAGKSHRVRFAWRNLGHYCHIQGILWLDLVRIFIKS